MSSSKSSTQKTLEGLRSDLPSPDKASEASSISFDSPSSREALAEPTSFTYKQFIEVPTEIAKRVALTKQGPAEYLFTSMLTEALTTATPEEQEVIKNSQLCAVMRENFGEILKNSVDAFTEKLTKDDDTEKLCLSMRLDVGETTLTMCLEDNCGGFPAKFLRRVVDEDQRRTYIDTKSASDKMGHSESIGGRGLGIRNLIANVETGHNLMGTTEERENGELVSKAVFSYHYVKPSISNIVFDNTGDTSEKRGASISVTMTKQPIVMAELSGRAVPAEDDEFELAPIPTLTFGSRF